MGSVTLEQGVCSVYKNHLFGDSFESILLYDNDLYVFKLIVDGNIWTKFSASQIERIGTSTKGSLQKKFFLYLVVEYPGGDEYSFNFQIPTMKYADDRKKIIYGFLHKEKARNDSVSLLKTRERVSTSEIIDAFKKYGFSINDSEARKFVEENISSGKIAGVLDGSGFVSKYALEREQVRYDIVTKFEIGSSGAVVLKCPGCGASLPIQDKEPDRKCSYCGASFVVPRKILDLI